MAVFGISRDMFNRDDRFNDLIRGISKASGINGSIKSFFTKYLNEVKQGSRNNDFYEDELLEKVVLSCVAQDKYNPEELFNKLKVRATIMFPFGKNTEGYEMLKELFINSVTAEIQMFNDSLFTFFDNVKDYVDIINIMNSEEKLIRNADKINQYAMDVSTCCTTQEELKKEIISFMYNVLRTDNITALAKEKLVSARKRFGDYPIDEKTLSLSVDNYEKAQKVMEKVENLDERANANADKIKLAGEAILKDIEDARKQAIKSVKKEASEVKEITDNAIATAVKDVAVDMKLKSEELVSQQFDKQREEFRQMKIDAATLSTTAFAEYRKMIEAGEATRRDLKSIIDNEDKLKDLFSKIAEQKVVEPSDTQAPTPKVEEGKARKKSVDEEDLPVDVPHIIIPGYDRIVVPLNSNVTMPDPSKIDRTILPAFDERIKFKTRFDAVKDTMYHMQKDHGVIFHEMAEEVIRCVMEGDWPYLWGPSGAGKSYLAEQVGEVLGLKVEENGKITDKYSIMAYNDPHGRFRATKTFVGVLFGRLVIYDEFDNGNNDTQVVLNGIYSKLWETIKNPDKPKVVTFGEDMTIPVHPNFRMISVGNTPGDGPNILYNVRKPIDESVQERVTHKYVDYDNNVERGLFGELDAWATLFFNFRSSCSGYNNEKNHGLVQGNLTTRDADAIVRYIDHNSKSLDQILREKFVQVKDADYLEHIVRAIREAYRSEGIKLEGVNNVSEKAELSKYTKEDLAKKLIYVADREITRKRRG